MNKFPLPSDERLQQLIAEAYEQMPGPEMRRLNQLQSRLARTASANKPVKKLNTLPWWVVLVLAGGFAAAAWWASDDHTDGNEQTLEYQFLQEGANPGTENAAGTNSPEPQPGEPIIERESPIIYLREEN